MKPLSVFLVLCVSACLVPQAWAAADKAPPGQPAAAAAEAKAPEAEPAETPGPAEKPKPAATTEAEPNLRMPGPLRRAGGIYRFGATFTPTLGSPSVPVMV